MSPVTACAIASGIPLGWSSSGPVEIVWHGGEPLAIGRATFVELIESFEPLRVAGRVQHKVQTGATLITDEWCDIFERYGMGVGVSIDGPRSANRHRLDRGGRPTFDRVIAALCKTTIASDSVLHGDPRLPASWWVDLDQALKTLATHPAPTKDEIDTLGYMTNGVREHFGITLHQAALAEITWTTAHADLHWGNITGPGLCILDWESWRPAPAGYDAATLYCNSLLHPPTAQRIREFFALFWTLIAVTSRCCSRYAATCGSWTRAVSMRL